MPLIHRDKIATYLGLILGKVAVCKGSAWPAALAISWISGETDAQQGPGQKGKNSAAFWEQGAEGAAVGEASWQTAKHDFQA